MNDAEKDAKELYNALENFQGDWYLYCLGEISRDDVNAASSRDAMKLLKRLQYTYRAEELREFAIATKPKLPTIAEMSGSINFGGRVIIDGDDQYVVPAPDKE